MLPDNNKMNRSTGAAKDVSSHSIPDEKVRKRTSSNDVTASNLRAFKEGMLPEMSQIWKIRTKEMRILSAAPQTVANM